MFVPRTITAIIRVASASLIVRVPSIRFCVHEKRLRACKVAEQGSEAVAEPSALPPRVVDRQESAKLASGSPGQPKGLMQRGLSGKDRIDPINGYIPRYQIKIHFREPVYL